MPVGGAIEFAARNCTRSISYNFYSVAVSYGPRLPKIADIKSLSDVSREYLVKAVDLFVELIYSVLSIDTVDPRLVATVSCM